jgi:hypothetical protein
LEEIMSIGSVATKPIARLVGADGNVFNLICRALRDAGLNAEAEELSNRCMKAGSYDEALCIMAEYCEIASEHSEDARGVDEYDELDEYEEYDEYEDKCNCDCVHCNNIDCDGNGCDEE